MLNWSLLTDATDLKQIQKEMEKRYLGTYLGIKTKDSTHFALYRGSLDNSFRFTDSNGVDLILNMDTNCSVFVPKLEKGLYNSSKGAIYVYKKSDRQWLRGMSTNTYTFHPLNELLVNKPTQNCLKSVIQEVLRNEFYTDIHSVFATVDLLGSSAVHPLYAVALSPFKTQEDFRYVLTYLNNPIGFVRGNEIFIDNPAFYQEVLDDNPLPDFKVSLWQN